MAAIGLNRPDLVDCRRRTVVKEALIKKTNEFNKSLRLQLLKWGKLFSLISIACTAEVGLATRVTIGRNWVIREQNHASRMA